MISRSSNNNNNTKSSKSRYLYSGKVYRRQRWRLAGRRALSDELTVFVYRPSTLDQTSRWNSQNCTSHNEW